MPTLSNAELLRVTGLRSEQSVRVLPALRQALVLLPVDPIHVSESPEWPLFATAVACALQKRAAPPPADGWITRWHVLRVIAQTVGILENREERPDELEWAINRAASRHWMEATGDASEAEPEILRPTLLGERLVREQLAGLAEKSGESVSGASAVERLREFRSAFLAYVQDAMNGQRKGVRPDPQSFATMQDAWIDVADVVYPRELYELTDIDAAVTERWPAQANVVWQRAERQIGQVIVSIGTEDRLQRARAAAFRADVDKLFPSEAAKTPAAPMPAIPPDAPQTPVTSIEYITRDRAAALCQKSKDSLERWFKDDPNAPEPIIEGGGGRAHRYDYAKLRPWLERMSGGMRLPERLPDL